jgi:D-threo-aldose 1-dehydrogenase
VLEPGAANPEFVGAPPLAPRFDYGPEGIRRSVHESLERLQLDRIDIALLHDPEDHLDEARRAVDVLRELVPRVGVGTNYVETAAAFVERGEVDLVLLAGRYTLLDHSAAHELLPLCSARGVSVIAAGVFNSGVLAGGSTFDYHAAPRDVRVGRQAREHVWAR